MPSVLDQMTAGLLQGGGGAIVQRKARAAASLTPVAGEMTTSVAEAAGLIPGDVPGVLMAREGLLDAAKQLRLQAAYLLKVADGLDVIAGVPAAVAADVAKQAAVDTRLAEKAADRAAADREAAAAGDKAAEKRVNSQEAFDARIAEQQQAAQAATFASLDAGEDEDDGPVTAAGFMAASIEKIVAAVDGKWACPTHGVTSVKDLTSKRGRQYRACAQCDEFEK